MGSYIDLKKLNLDELLGVINLYPWFGGARKELCIRMSRMGEALSDAQCAETAMYVVAREKVAALRKLSADADWTDTDVEKLLKSYISEKPAAVEQKVYVVGGDFFSQAEYDRVRQADDNVFSRYAGKSAATPVHQPARAENEICFYTETLAQIYAEQGYFEQARDIYSKLILAYPERSAYFASLIEKIDKINS